MSDPNDLRKQLLQNDLDGLMLSAPFLRFMYSVLNDAGVLRGGNGANPVTLQWWEGRRSLGLDILNTLQGRVPDALLQVLSEEAKTLKENPIGKRTPDRRDELNPRDPDGNRRSDGYAYLAYDE